MEKHRNDSSWSDDGFKYDAEQKRPSPVLRFLHSSPEELLIHGRRVPARAGKSFGTINLATEDVLALVAEGDKADVDEEVNAARRVFEEGRWPNIGPHQRARYLFKRAELIEGHGDEVAELIILDNGTLREAVDVCGQIISLERTALHVRWKAIPAPGLPQHGRFENGRADSIAGATFGRSDPRRGSARGSGQHRDRR